MFLIGFFSSAIIFGCIWAMLATGRKGWLLPVFWAFILSSIVHGVKNGAEIDGFFVIITFCFAVMCCRAYFGVIMWNYRKIKTGVVLPMVTYAVTLLLSVYALMQAQRLGYIYDFQDISKRLHLFRYIVGWVFIAIIAIPTSMQIRTCIERFFSNPSELILLDCECYAGGEYGGKVMKGYFLNGINNGVKYHFKLTKRTYFMLKKEKRLILSVKKSFRNMLFVTKSPCIDSANGVKERDKRQLQRVFISGIIYFPIVFWLLIR